MDLSKKPKDEGMELGFAVPETGEYIMQITEGIDLWKPEESQARAVMVPLRVDSVVNGKGSEESIDRKVTYFIMLTSKEGKHIQFGDAQLVNLLNCTDLLDGFAKKYQGDVDPFNEKFLGDLKLRLVGKFLRISGEKKKDSKDKDRFNITGVYPAKTTSKATAPKAAPAGADW